MSQDRIKGHEVVIRLTKGGRPVSITAIKSFSLQFDMDIVEGSYLGEKSVRKDDVFKGVSGSFEIDHESQDALLLADFLKRRAARQLDPSESSSINITVRLNFPNGQRPKIIIPDPAFGAIPVAASGREAYVSSTFTFGAEDARVLAV